MSDKKFTSISDFDKSHNEQQDLRNSFISRERTPHTSVRVEDYSEDGISAGFGSIRLSNKLKESQIIRNNDDSSTFDSLSLSTSTNKFNSFPSIDDNSIHNFSSSSFSNSQSGSLPLPFEQNRGRYDPLYPLKSSENAVEPVFPSPPTTNPQEITTSTVKSHNTLVGSYPSMMGSLQSSQPPFVLPPELDVIGLESEELINMTDTSTEPSNKVIQDYETLESTMVLCYICCKNKSKVDCFFTDKGFICLKCAVGMNRKLLYDWEMVNQVGFGRRCERLKHYKPVTSFVKKSKYGTYTFAKLCIYCRNIKKWEYMNTKNNTTEKV